LELAKLLIDFADRIVYHYRYPGESLCVKINIGIAAKKYAGMSVVAFLKDSYRFRMTRLAEQNLRMTKNFLEIREFLHSNKKSPGEIIKKL